MEYKVVTSFILHLEYKWSIVLQSRHTRGGGINIFYNIASIMVYQYVARVAFNDYRVLFADKSWHRL